VVDSPNSGEVQTPAPPKPPNPVLVFLGSSTGRLIIGGVFLFAVVVAAGAFLFFSLLNSGGPSAPATSTTPGSTGTTQTAVEATRPPDVPLDETFTFRNVFAPTVKIVVVATSTVSSTSTASSTTTSTSSKSTTGTPSSTAASGTLVLTKIVTESGKPTATFTWNGGTYKAQEGDRIDSSPWKVLTIYSDSVLLLYGDSRVTLTVGQGYTKSTQAEVTK
jgi:type IV pilus biogenesis protein PilP